MINASTIQRPGPESPVDEKLDENFRNLEQVCGTPNIYRQFNDKTNPHRLATTIYKTYLNNSDKFRLSLEFDKATISDLLSIQIQSKKENRLFHKIRDSYLNDHSTVAKYNIKRLYRHFQLILEPDKSSINGLSLNYLTVLFAPVIIHVKIKDDNNQVLKAAIQTAIFQTIFHRYSDFFNNIDRTNTITPNESGFLTYRFKELNAGIKVEVFKPRYKNENGETCEDDWYIIKVDNVFHTIHKNYIRTDEIHHDETTSKDKLAEKNQFFNDFE